MSFLTPAALAALGVYGGVPSLAAYGAYRGARSLTKRRGSTRNMRRIARIPKSLSIKGVHSFKRSIDFELDYIPSTGFQLGATTTNQLSLAFSLQDVRLRLNAVDTLFTVPNSTQLTSLFDRYRIKGVNVRIFYSHTSNDGTTNANSGPVIHYVWDNMDNATVNEADILQYETTRQYQFANGSSTTGFSTFGRPRPLLDTGILNTDGTTTGSRLLSSKDWLDNTTPAVQHNALKIVNAGGIGTQATIAGRMKFIVCLYYECKDVI